MVGVLGPGLMGFVDAYPQAQQMLMDQQMQQMKMQQMRTQIQQQQAARQAYQQALTQMSQQPGQGPGGTPSFQQMAGMSGGNPDVMQGLSDMSKPYINPYASLQRTQMQGDYGLQRTQMQGDNQMNRQQMAGDQAQQRTQMQGDYGLQRTQMQGDNAAEAADIRAKATTDAANIRSTTAENIAAKKTAASKTPGSTGFRLSNDPQYQTLKNEFEANKQFALSVLNQFGPNSDKYIQAKRDFENSKKALEGYTPKEITATPAAATQTDQPPIPGAQKAPDGNWYVQQNGQFFKVGQ